MPLISPSIRAVAFDCFGTLMRIKNPRMPYAKMMACASNMLELRRLAMTEPIDFRACAAKAVANIDPALLDYLADGVIRECEAIELYPETREVIQALRGRGLQLAVCSNLALPYVAPAVRLLEGIPYLAHWSCEQGAVKPEPGIYASLCERLNCAPQEVLMVGDSWKADVQGAVGAGLEAVWIARDREMSGAQKLNDRRIPVISRLSTLLE